MQDQPKTQVQTWPGSKMDYKGSRQWWLYYKVCKQVNTRKGYKGPPDGNTLKPKWNFYNPQKNGTNETTINLSLFYPNSQRYQPGTAVNIDYTLL